MTYKVKKRKTDQYLGNGWQYATEKT